jgi:hypothetical protein
VDGKEFPLPPASGGKATAYIETLGVIVTLEMTQEGVHKMFHELGIPGDIDD